VAPCCPSRQPGKIGPPRNPKIGELFGAVRRVLSMRRRAEQAVVNYVGNLDSLRGSIDIACRIVEDTERRDFR